VWHVRLRERFDRWNPNGRAEGNDFQMWISRHDEYA
jgi:hypothetical protein